MALVPRIKAFEDIFSLLQKETYRTITIPESERLIKLINQQQSQFKQLKQQIKSDNQQKKHDKDKLEALQQKADNTTITDEELTQLEILEEQEIHRNKRLTIFEYIQKSLNDQLFIAVREQNVIKINELLFRGAMPDYQEPFPSGQPSLGEWDNPTTPLSLAAQNNNLEIVMLLLHELGEHHDQFDINKTDMSNETALHKAVNNNNEDIVVELLEHGIDKTIVGGEMEPVTAADLARRNGNQDLATLIDDHDYINPGNPSMKGMLNQKYQVNYRQKYLKYKSKYLNLKKMKK